MSRTRPPIDPVRWARLKDHVADLTELDADARRTALADLVLDASDREWLEAIVAPLLAGDTRMLEPHAPALAAVDDRQLRWQVGDTIGRYRIEGLLGRGGMGEVYEARERGGGRLVALKVLRAGLAHDDYVRFSENEQRALRRLDDPRIAKFIEAFAAPDAGACLVLEWIDGEPLQTYCRGRRFDVAARLKLFIEVCQAVASAHQQLVVHRDLKPSNVLVTPDGHVKLLDFGVSKLLDDDPARTQTSGHMFTLDYAAPEQVLHAPVSTATDVYALGVLLYRLLTDVSPYERRTDRSLVEAILHDPPQHLAVGVELARADGHMPAAGPLDRDLDRVIAQAMEKEPRHRYGSALELAADVAAVLEGRPIRAGGGALYRLRKFARRHRAGVAAASVAAIVLIAATLFSLHAASRAERQAHRAEVANRFLLTTFDLTDRFSTKNRGDFTLTEVLERAVVQAHVDLRDEPEVHASVLVQLSRALQNRGKHAAALSAARDAYRIRTTLHGDDAAERATAAQQLASLEIEAGLLDEAGLHLEETLAQLALAGAQDVARIGAYTSFGKLASIRGDAEASLRWYQQIVPLREALPGNHAAELAMDYGNLGTGLFNLSRFREADVNFVKAIDLLQTSLGAAHPRIGIIEYSRIVTMIQLGRFDEARELLTEAEAKLDVSGSSPGAVNTERVRAQLDYFAGDFTGALRRLELALVQTRNASPISVAATLNWRGRSELATGDAASAAGSFAEAERLFTDNGRAEHAQRWYSRGMHGVARVAHGDVVEGDALLDDALAHMSNSAKRVSAEQAELLLHAGASARRRGDIAAALLLHRRAQAMQRETGWLGELGQARVDSELAQDDLTEGTDRATRVGATALLAHSIAVMQRINPTDPRLAPLRELQRATVVR